MKYPSRGVHRLTRLECVRHFIAPFIHQLQRFATSHHKVVGHLSEPCDDDSIAFTGATW
jgi:hypothetical protein